MILRAPKTALKLTVGLSYFGACRMILYIHTHEVNLSELNVKSAI